MTTEPALINLHLSKPPDIGVENYQYQQQIWKQEQLNSAEDFLHSNNNKGVVLAVEAIQKKIALCYDKDISMLNLDCTIALLVNICLHICADPKFYLFTGGDKELLEKN